MVGNSYIQTVERAGWNFYDISNPEAIARAPGDPWQVLERQGPAEFVLDGGTYFLAPQPAKGERLVNAHARVAGLGPCLRIGNAISPEYKRLNLVFSPGFVVFTKLAMEGAGVRLFMDPLPDGMTLDHAVLPLKTAEATFARDFDIMDDEERQFVRRVIGHLSNNPPPPA